MIKYEVHVYDGTKFWFLNGKLHRTDGPAKEWSDGSKEWFLNGQLHRTDGPAYEVHVYDDGTKEWFLNGKLHRTDGPAVEWFDGIKEWYLNDREYTEAEWLKALNPIKELTVAEVSQLLGYEVKIVK